MTTTAFTADTEVTSIGSSSSSSGARSRRELLDLIGPERVLPGQSLISAAVDFLEKNTQISYSTSGCHPWLIRFGVEIEPVIATITGITAAGGE